MLSTPQEREENYMTFVMPSIKAMLKAAFWGALCAVLVCFGLSLIPGLGPAPTHGLLGFGVLIGTTPLENAVLFGALGGILASLIAKASGK